MDELKQTVARNLIALRTAQHLTQYELGVKPNYSDKAVSRWERGEAIPDASVLLQMSDLFGVSVDDLLRPHGKGQPFPAAPARAGINYRVITLIALTGVWTVALLVFIVLHLLGYTRFIIFAHTLPVSLIVLLVLNTLWGNRHHNVYILSLFHWSVLAAIYLSFLHHNWWILFLLGIPAQIITCLCFRIRMPHPKAKSRQNAV